MQSQCIGDSSENHKIHNNYNIRRQVKQKMICIFDWDQLFEKKLYKVGNCLENPKRTNAVRSKSVLNECAYFSFGIDQEKSDNCIKKKEKNSDYNHFRHNRPEWRHGVMK